MKGFAPCMMAIALACVAAQPVDAGDCQAHWNASMGQPGANAWLYWLSTLDAGTGPAVYAGGDFTSIGGVSATGIARWNGSQWSSMGLGLNHRTFAIEVYDDGTGPSIYAGGDFTMSGSTPIGYVAKFNATTQQWEQVGAGFDNAVIALAVFDDGMGAGPALYAGGLFESSGGTITRCVARWTGTSWHEVGGGMNDSVRAFAVYDDGDGPHLYCGGLFSTAGGANISRAAKWSGTQWLPLGTGIGAAVIQGPRTMAVCDVGDGPALYFGGNFQSAGGILAANVARWKNGQWSALGSGVNERLVNMCAFDDGTGEKLYCGGWFTAAGGVPVAYTATWNGQSWSALGAGTNTVVRGLAPWTPEGENPRLVIGGGFTTAGGQVALHIAQWQGCAEPTPIPGDINGDGAVSVQDMLAVINAWGACPIPPQPCDADVAPAPNGDDIVNVADLLMVINNWG